MNIPTLSTSETTLACRKLWTQVVLAIEDRALRECCARIWDFPEFFWYGGSHHKHHAYPHGLLIHTLEVVSGAVGIVTNTPTESTGDFMRQADVTLAAALWHDVGKIWDYTVGLKPREEVDQLKPWQRGVIFLETDGGMVLMSGYNDAQKKRVHHVQESFARFRIEAEKAGVSPDLILEVGSAILAHHGRKEWGSIVEPLTLESMALHQADMLSAHHGTYSKGSPKSVIGVAVALVDDILCHFPDGYFEPDGSDGLDSDGFPGGDERFAQADAARVERAHAAPAEKLPGLQLMESDPLPPPPVALNGSFLARMHRELEENNRKGNWSEWNPGARSVISEIRHHTTKLHAALLEADKSGGDAFKEFAADVGNLAMKAYEFSPRSQHSPSSRRFIIGNWSRRQDGFFQAGIETPFGWAWLVTFQDPALDVGTYNFHSLPWIANKAEDHQSFDDLDVALDWFDDQYKSRLEASL